jgi:hypothetical protein
MSIVVLQEFVALRTQKKETLLVGEAQNRVTLGEGHVHVVLGDG